jgi:hypothetical protein
LVIYYYLNFQAVSDEDDDNMENLTVPELTRGYSDQKKQYQKAFRAFVLDAFRTTESEFDFRNMIL